MTQFFFETLTVVDSGGISKVSSFDTGISSVSSMPSMDDSLSCRFELSTSPSSRSTGSGIIPVSISSGSSVDCGSTIVSKVINGEAASTGRVDSGSACNSIGRVSSGLISPNQVSSSLVS